MANFLNLKYFILVADEKNITRVAEKEHISQQALSGHIKKLEDEYGVKLFDRTGGLSLTYAGQILYDHAIKIIEEAREMNSEVCDLKDTRQGMVRLGLSYTRGSVFLPEVLPGFTKENPFVKIIVTENNSQVLEEYLIKGHIDLYIGANIKESSEIKVEKLISEKMYLVVPNSIAEEVYGTESLNKETADITDFAEYPFLMLSSGNSIRARFDKYISRKNITPKIKLEAENIETLFALACEGMGITVYPEMFLRRHTALLGNNESPVRCFILNEDFGRNELSIAYRGKRYMSDAVARFLKKAKQIDD